MNECRVTRTKIVFYKLLNVLPLVEHPQLYDNVRTCVELLDEVVNILPHPDVDHSDTIRL